MGHKKNSSGASSGDDRNKQVQSCLGFNFDVPSQPIHCSLQLTGRLPCRPVCLRHTSNHASIVTWRKIPCWVHSYSSLRVANVQFYKICPSSCSVTSRRHPLTPLQLLVVELALQLLGLGHLAYSLVEIVLVNRLAVVLDGKQATV